MQTTPSRSSNRQDRAPVNGASSDPASPGPAFSGTAVSGPAATGRYVAAGVLAAASLTMFLLFGDATALTAIGYLPILIVRAIFTETNDLPLLWQPELLRSVLTLAGTAALAAAAYAALPVRPIFNHARAGTVSRMRNIAVTISMIIPIGYAITRLAWFFGIPLGVTSDFLEQVDEILVAGAGLATFAIVGAVLTWGLTRPWGAVFPRWIPRLRGRRVPIGLARNSAIVVGFVVLSAGGYFIRSIINGDISIAPDGAEGQIAAWLPELFWPLWGIALIVAALAYAELRRRTDTGRRDLDNAEPAATAP